MHVHGLQMEVMQRASRLECANQRSIMLLGEYRLALSMQVCGAGCAALKPR
jgi:hypothetical protein